MWHLIFTNVNVVTYVILSGGNYSYTIRLDCIRLKSVSLWKKLQWLTPATFNFLRLSRVGPTDICFESNMFILNITNVRFKQTHRFVMICFTCRYHSGQSSRHIMHVFYILLTSEYFSGYMVKPDYVAIYWMKYNYFWNNCHMIYIHSTFSSWYASHTIVLGMTLNYIRQSYPCYNNWVSHRRR